MSHFGDLVYRLLLFAFPARVRRDRGQEMLAQFREAYAATRRHPIALASFWIAAAWDAALSGILDRANIVMPIAGSPGRDSMSNAPMPSPRRGRVITETLSDMRYGARRLGRSPGFTFVAVLTLALGIGGTSAIFSVVYGVLLKPLPFAHPERVVGLFQVWKGKRDVFAPANFIDVQARAKSFSNAGAYTTSGVTLTNAGEPARLIDAEVTAGFFDVLETMPLLGRTLNRGDNEPGHADVVVLSYALWNSRFGANRDIVGTRITMDASPRTVVGVMPNGSTWPLEADCWTPAEYTPRYVKDSRGAWYIDAFARLKPGVTEAQSALEMADLGRQLEKEYPDMDGNVGMTSYSLLDNLLGDTKRALLVLLGAVGFVLLIACANVANLLFARAATRENELAVRVALGAGRWRLVRHALAESVVLALIGGTAGLALAYGGIQLLQAVRPPGIPRLDAVGLDLPVVIFTIAATMLTGLICGLTPAMHITDNALATALRERGRSALSGVRGRRIRGALVAAEMALAVLLLAGAGLLIRSFTQLLRVSPGFEVGQAATFRIGLPEATYKDDARRLAFYDRATSELAALPGVTGVGAVMMVPPSGSMFDLTFEITGRPPVKPSDQPAIEIRVADANYFDVMRIPVRRGRLFTSADRASTTPVVVITESAARRHFPNEDPIGKHMVIGWKRGEHRVEGDIIGVVADVKSFGLEKEAPPQLYVPLSQVPVESMSFVVRTAIAPATLFSGIRAAMARIDPNLPVNKMETLEAHVNSMVAERRFYMFLLMLFASVALVLASVGIFGVLSFLVAQRTREIGIRIALGASRGEVISMVLRQAMAVAVAGIVIGTTGALALSRVMQTMLFHLQPTDPATFISVAAMLLTVALIASWAPARRAVGVDPMVALRDE